MESTSLPWLTVTANVRSGQLIVHWIKGMLHSVAFSTAWVLASDNRGYQMSTGADPVAGSSAHSVRRTGMNSRTRLACGVAIGYLLGRTRKMRLALMIAGATGAVGTPRQLVERGLKQLAAVPEVGKLTTVARGQLVDAAKTAAITAASSRIDALDERLRARTAGDDEDEQYDDDRADDRAEDGENDRQTDDEASRPRRRASTARRATSTDDAGDKPRRGSQRRSSRAPVRRAGR